MVASAVVGKSSPGKPSLRDTQHYLKHGLILPSVESQRGDKVACVNFRTRLITVINFG
jgi:hypothetical protein